MTPPNGPSRTLIYHFTHIDNVDSILAAGRLVGDALVRELPGFTEVGDVAIKDRRRRRSIPVGPGGTVADYVPFYFAPRSPMMFRIFYDHRDGAPDRYPDGVDPLVYLVDWPLMTETYWKNTPEDSDRVRSGAGRPSSWCTVNCP